MRISDIIAQKLTEVLAPKRLSIVDLSDRHHDHQGSGPHAESHFQLVVVSEHFVGMSQLARQKLIYDLLATELRNQIHALSMRTLTPEEDIPQKLSALSS